MDVINIHSQKKTKVLIVLILLVNLVLSFYACKDTSTGPGNEGDGGQETPRTELPAQLAGHWYTGNISSINFFNPATGQWGSPSGTGMFFKFTTDGHYEKGVLLQSSLYGCSSSFMAYNKGTVVIDDDLMTLHPTYGRIMSVDNCVAENNYEKTDEIDSENMLWEIGLDEYGFKTLWLSYPNGNPSAFHLED